jgi:hypothetical protein
MERVIGSVEKFKRAEGLYEELHEVLSLYAQTRPFELEPDEDTETGDLRLRIRIREQPPIQTSVWIGDVVHNTRTALDYAAGALVEKEGGNPEYAAFPIVEREEKYDQRAEWCLPGAPNARAAVKALAPWPGGDNDLWWLHRLDIIDKHRLLVPVGAVHSIVGLGMTYTGDVFDEPVTFPIVPLYPTERPLLTDGDVVFTAQKAAREPNPDVQTNFELHFDVAFGEVEVASGEPVLRTLRRLMDHTREVLERVLP